MRIFNENIRIAPLAGATPRRAAIDVDGTIIADGNGTSISATDLKAESNNSWSNTGPGTAINSSYRHVLWPGNKLYSPDGATLYGEVTSDTGEAGSGALYLDSYPAIAISGADLQISRYMAAQFGGTAGAPFFISNGEKFGDGGGILLFPNNNGEGGGFYSLGTGFGAKRITGGGALIATTVSDDTDADHTQAIATWDDTGFRTNAALFVDNDIAISASSARSEAFNSISGDQTISYDTLESKWRYTGSGGHTVTLPAASSGGGYSAPVGFVFEIKNAGSGTLTVARGYSTHLIEGSASISVAPGGCVTLRAGTSTAWDIISWWTP